MVYSETSLLYLIIFNEGCGSESGRSVFRKPPGIDSGSGSVILLLRRYLSNPDPETYVLFIKDSKEFLN
jgi:hypothetical protein